MLYGKSPPSSCVTPDPPTGTSTGGCWVSGLLGCCGIGSAAFFGDLPKGEGSAVFFDGLGFSIGLGCGCTTGSVTGAGCTAGVISGAAAGCAKRIVIVEVDSVAL